MATPAAQPTEDERRALWSEYMIDGARYDDLADVREALAQGADCNARDGEGRSALHMAAANGFVEVARCLLAAGANTELSNGQGSTALHWACVGGHAELVRVLLQHGANPSALNKLERTPVDEGLDKPELLQLFQELDAEAHTSSAQSGTADDQLEGGDASGGEDGEVEARTERAVDDLSADLQKGTAL